ncbi:MAG: DNA translocase FtsK 4TM domain-containing protein [Paludibacteraceae bacterium]|nr:DNA translocase FtsK 4TM domain-containing protein [Paludibacteraceae bacterium]
MSEKDLNNTSETTKKVFVSKARIESFKIVFGLCLILFSLYVALALVSYFFTGGADQSLIEHLDLTTSDEIKVQIQNWTGYRGAKLSEFLIAKSFGIPCFIMDYFLARWGLKLMGFFQLNSFKLLCTCIFFTIWTSFLFSFLGLENSFFNFGGHCGKSEVDWVEAQIGMPGAFLVLAFTIILYFYFFKGMSVAQMKENFFAFFRKLFRKEKKENEDQVQGTDTETEHANKLVEEVNTVENKNNGKEPVVFAKDSTENEPQNNTVESADSNNSTTLSGSETPAKEETVGENLNEGGVEDAEKVVNDPGKEEIVFTINDTNDSKEPENIDPNEDDPDNLDNDPAMVDESTDIYEELLAKNGPYDPTAELPDFEMPSIDLLTDYPVVNFKDEGEQIENKDKIIQVLKNFNIDITSIEATIGPTITLYEVVPAPGIRISKIQSLAPDIALSLAAKGIRIIAPIPGKGTVGIEVPNKKPQIVSMRSVIASKAFQESKAELPVAFGRTITNDVFMVDLAKTPHLLVAGATGMGKSVGLNVLLTSLLYKKHPATMKLVMVDPKQVEFSIYERIEKHYLAKLPGDANAIITDTTKVVQTLTSLTTEMENRYSLLADVHLRNIKEYNERFISRRINPAKELPNGLMHHYLPYIVVIIDEYGDLLMTAGKEIETPIARIAQKARAVGIHMVIATQRPSVKIVTGTIKANFPARLAFRVASRTDSQTILDATGAQELVGKGDMLYSTGGAENTRVQCAFVDTPEVEKINDFIGNQHGYPEAYRLPEYIDENNELVGAPEFDAKTLDPRLQEAAELVVNCQNGSTSNIQRTLEVGFNRAGRIMDQLQAIGVVGPVCGSKPREVLVQSLEDVSIIFTNLKK